MTTKKSSTNKSLPFLASDSLLHDQTVQLIDSLHLIDIDSIVIYTVSYPGYYSNDSCVSGSYPVTSFVIWMLNTNTYCKKLKGKCISNTIKIDSSKIFDFIKNNYSILTREIFMPVIYEAVQKRKNNIKYSMRMIDHEPKYSISYILNNIYENKEFTEIEISDNKSLFYKDNLNLKSHVLWMILKSELIE